MPSLLRPFAGEFKGEFADRFGDRGLGTVKPNGQAIEVAAAGSTDSLRRAVCARIIEKIEFVAESLHP